MPASAVFVSARRFVDVSDARSVVLSAEAWALPKDPICAVVKLFKVVVVRPLTWAVARLAAFRALSTVVVTELI